MTVTLAFFNVKGGVGRTTLVYHLAHMLVRMNRRVLLVDLDPQANLSAMCMPPERLDEVWDESDGRSGKTVLDWAGTMAQTWKAPVEPLPVEPLPVESVDEGLGLLVGHPWLHAVEGELSIHWGTGMTIQVVDVFGPMVRRAMIAHRADVAIMDMSPNLGTINRSALLAADHIVTPLVSDTSSLLGLRHLGSAMDHWRERWRQLLESKPEAEDVSTGRMNPLGYVVMQGTIRDHRTTQASNDRILQVARRYHHDVLHDELAPVRIEDDPFYLGTLRHHHGLAFLAQDARKPMFALKPADGAVGAYARAVALCEEEYRSLATKLLARLPALRGE